MLDKYAMSWGEPDKPKQKGKEENEKEKETKFQEAVQKPTLEKVVELSRQCIKTLDFDGLCQRRRRMLNAIGAEIFTGVTTGPLTLHLARASALENAGLCLHPLYGFAYLPGSGLKGMARAYAETVWLASQPEGEHGAAWCAIEDVFGWADTPDRRKQIADRHHPAQRRREDSADAESPEINAHGGGIVFHDAWPEDWPELIVDITNNHHAKYYQSEAKGQDFPPGDWENPIPVYFLAVKPDRKFSFALSARRGDSADGGRLLGLAKDWLMGALYHLGAGAKTNAGYGAFRLEGERAPRPESPAREEWRGTLELVTPAFLAGANQKEEDCDLRPAALRGLLRWWWRTLHAAHVDVPTLRAMEAAVWGDTNAGSAVKVVVEREGGWRPERYDKKSQAPTREEDKTTEFGISGADRKKTTLGLWYASFGMDDIRRGERKQRYFAPPGTKWRVRFDARSTQFREQEISAGLVLQQAQAALWLLCRFGGVGSKSRKGFGSLKDVDIQGLDLEGCKRWARAFRKGCEAPERIQQRPDSPALERMLEPVEVETDWAEPWFALDQAGYAMQAFAQGLKHQTRKRALGLPRKIGEPQSGQFRAPKGDRHASPVHYHLARNHDGKLTVRVVAFPAKFLPDWETSEGVLHELMAHLETDFGKRAKL
jgi:CRISPR-associated protein Cmr6